MRSHPAALIARRNHPITVGVLHDRSAGGHSGRTTRQLIPRGPWKELVVGTRPRARGAHRGREGRARRRASIGRRDAAGSAASAAGASSQQGPRQGCAAREFRTASRAASRSRRPRRSSDGSGERGSSGHHPSRARGRLDRAHEGRPIGTHLVHVDRYPRRAQSSANRFCSLRHRRSGSGSRLRFIGHATTVRPPPVGSGCSLHPLVQAVSSPMR